MNKEWRYFLLAIGFFTRIPVPNFPEFRESDLNHSAKYFPLVGIIVGLAGAITYYTFSLLYPNNIALLISMATTIYLTGAFHEDGLADSADGIGGGWQREQILTIMQDSRLGTFGAVALFLMLISKYQTLNLINATLVPLLLVSGHALSRLCAVWIMATADYVKASGKSKPLATEIKKSHLLIANFFGLLPFIVTLVLLEHKHHSTLLVLKYVLMTLLLVWLSWYWWRSKIIKNIHGYTGDTLGATQQITELAFYLSALACGI